MVVFSHGEEVHKVNLVMGSLKAVLNQSLSNFLGALLCPMFLLDGITLVLLQVFACYNDLSFPS